MTDPTAAPTAAAKLARALHALVADLTLISESDRQYRPFDAPLAADTELTADTFRAAAHIGPRYRIDLASATDWFAYYTDAEVHGPAAASYALLEQVMGATLTELHTVYVRGAGVIKVRFFLCGRLSDHLVGLRSLAIET